MKRVCQTIFMLVAMIFSISIVSVDAEEGRICNTTSEWIYYEAESAKNWFFNSNFEEFLKFSNEFVIEELGDRQAVVNTLTQAFPHGFTGCKTILSNELSPSIVEQIVLYELETDEFFFIYFVLVQIGSEWTMQTYLLTNKFEEILQRLN